MARIPNMREITWAEMKPDCYGGDNCDEIVPRWNVYTDGDKQDEDMHDPIIMDPSQFPPGTKVTVAEPVCPECGDFRSRKFPPSEAEFVDKCECGFDWVSWTLEQYS